MLAAPIAAAAQVYPAFAWPSSYAPLPLAGGQAPSFVPLLNGTIPDGDAGEARDYLLPFPVRFNGVSYARINLGSKGYVTFGSSPTEHRASSSGAALLLLPNHPKNVVAAWWGDHYCSPGSPELETQLLGSAPGRRFVIQWDCAKRSGAGTATASRFRAQLWFFEGEELFRVKYDRLSGFVGADPDQDWLDVSWGIKVESAGMLGPGRDGLPASCEPAPILQDVRKCKGLSDFPDETTIQYGLSTQPDLLGSIQAEEAVISGSSLYLDPTIHLWNAGATAAAGKLSIYLSASTPLRVGAAGTFLAGERILEEALEGGSSISFSESLVLPRGALPSGRYWMCLSIEADPETSEFDVSNNASCSRERVLVGPDLLGLVSGPTEAEAGEEISLTIEIQNQGSEDARSFGYRVRMIPERLSNGVLPPELDLMVGRVEGGLAAGATLPLQALALVPNGARAAFYTLRLDLDPAGEVGDADPTNNTSFSLSRMRNRRPSTALTPSSLSLRLPSGCHYGEEIEGSLEVCNLGDAPAQGFHPGIAMGSDRTVSFTYDEPAATFPQTCFSPGDPNYMACLPLGDLAPICSNQKCELGCETNADCGASGLVCAAATSDRSGARRCVNHLAARANTTAPPSCRTFEVRGRIPVTNAFGEPYEAGLQRFFFLDDVFASLNQDEPDQLSIGEHWCEESLPDLIALRVDAPRRMTAGEASPITRLIRNLGFIERGPGGAAEPSMSFEYRYYLASSPDVSVHQIPLAVQATGGAGMATIARKGDNLRTELVTIPASLRPGSYYLGLVLDPAGSHRELSKGNNVFVVAEPIEVGVPGLQVITQSLPPVIVGSNPSFSLLARGGYGGYRWSSPDLPQGMSLSEGGILGGSPASLGAHPFTVRVASDSLFAERLLIVEVVPAQTPLEILTASLPPGSPGSRYGERVDELGVRSEGVKLAAAGGVPPYEWSLDTETLDNVLPAGLTGPTSAGWIMGTPTPSASSRSIAVQVRDARGTLATRTILLQILGSRDLRIPAEAFADGISGRVYETSCVEAMGGDASSGYEWEIDEASLPAGVHAESRGSVVCLQGTPTVCGSFRIGVTVWDSRRESYAREIPLLIECGVIQLLERSFAPLERGEEVELQLASNAGVGARYRLYQGSLPEGLALEVGGRIVGTVSEHAAFGPYPVIVEIQDEEGRRGLGALSLQVQVVPRAQATETITSGGCGSAGRAADPSWILFVALGGMLGWRSSRAGRREGSVAAGLVPALVGALLLVGAGGCGETTEVITKARCDAVSCEGASSCDPLDGLCKCGGAGGAICKEEEVCSLEGGPHCVLDRCQFVECQQGERCEPSTGDCGCGGGDPCIQGERCVADRCVAPDRCADVHCVLGTSCDPEDGSCRCAGTICAKGEACVEGSCSFDPCAGVSCGANSRCNPEDGRCHCASFSGPICETGEACTAIDGSASLGCAWSSRCEGVVCGGGASCDPADGQCRCGAGAAAPICGDEQSCVNGQCLGGSLCAPDGVQRQCPPDLSCDPGSGLCTCGGAGGEICGEGELCRYLDGSLGCARSCALLDGGGGCATGQGCYIDGRQEGHGAFCASAGSAAVDWPCEEANDCAPGLFCSRANECRKLCLLSDGERACDSVSSIHRCQPLGDEGPPGVGYCVKS